MCLTYCPEKLKGIRVFQIYGQPGSEYSSFKEHPAYFPINKSQYSYNNDRSVESGWANVGWFSKEQNIPQSAENLTWPIGDPNGKKLGKIDYAIYELGRNASLNLPANEHDPWPWLSDNNQASPQTFPHNLYKPWALPDNTNGFRGWTRVTTRRLAENTLISVMGFAGVVNNGPYYGVNIVNSGYFVGYENELAFAEREDVLIFKDADLMPGNSGSSVIANNLLAGVAAWTDCAPGGMANWPSIAADILLNPGDYNRPAKNYASPMWKICRASRVIKNLARDQNCNGRDDWWDFMLSAPFLPGNISEWLVGIGGNVFGALEPSSLSIPVKNYRYDKNLKKVLVDKKTLQPHTYQLVFDDNGDVFNVIKQNGHFYVSRNGMVSGMVFDYPELKGSKAVLHDNDIYLAGGYFAGIMDGYLYNDNSEVQFITRIEYNGQSGYDFLPVTEFPANLEDVRIVSLGNHIYLTGNTQSNFVVYKLVEDSQSQYGYSLNIVNSDQPVRKDYNLAISENSIVVSGGATDYFSTVAQLDLEQYPDDFFVYNNIIMINPATSSNWVTVAENINHIMLAMNVTAIEDNNFLIFNPFIDVENSIQKVVIDLSDIPLNGDDISISFSNLELPYCLKEENNTLYSGRVLGDDCTPFTEKEFESIPMGTTVHALAGSANKLAVGTGYEVRIYDISVPFSPSILHTKNIYGPAADMLIYDNKLIIGVENGIDTIDLTTFEYTHKATYGSTKALRMYNGKLYAGDGQGIKVLNPDNLQIINERNTSGSVKKLEIMNGVIYTVEWAGLKRFNAETLATINTSGYSVGNPELRAYNGNLYASRNGTIVKLTFNSSNVIASNLTGDRVDLRNNFSNGRYTYFPNGSNIRVSTIEDIPEPVCGNGIIEHGELCDNNSVQCSSISSSYVGGIAICNSTCNGYYEGDCETDGW
jgi:hypothetical protein